jgi:MFS family permease
VSITSSLTLSSDESYQKLLSERTRSAFLWTRILGIPFWGLINFLSIILYKDLHISAFQVILIITLKPMSALLSPYWSQVVYQRPDRMVSNLVWANILRYLPFLFIPWIDSPWIIIAAFALCMTLYRGVIPSWMETIKCNLPATTRERLIASGTIIDYGGAIVLPLCFGLLLDGYDHSWRWLFPLTAAIGLFSTIFIYRIPQFSLAKEPCSTESDLWSCFKEHLIQPWKQLWKLMRENSAYASYQIGFMFLGGTGLIIVQPALPVYFVDVLNLSYTEMFLALTAFKGIGVAIASRFWVRLFQNKNFYFFSSLVTGIAILFPLLLLGAQIHIVLLYAAYTIYGVMQAGSELGWHMSGPVFAGEKDSTIFSGTNVLTVGIRGCLIPPLGALLLSSTSPLVVMLVASLMCAAATVYLRRSVFVAKPIQKYS